MREAVHLRLRQRVGAVQLHRVLRGDHEERLGQVVARAVHADLVLGHRLQQRRLRARRGPVDLVGQQDMREHRPEVELERLGLRVEDRHAEDVRGQQVGRELDALELGVHRLRQRFRQRGLAGARIVLQQHVAAGDKCRDHLAHGGRLPADDLWMLSAMRRVQRKLITAPMLRNSSSSVRNVGQL